MAKLEEGFIVDKPEEAPQAGGLPGYERLTPEEQYKQLKKMYREVFGTPHGKIVLTSILEDLNYFAICNSEEQRCLNNYAKVLMSERLGINNNMKMIEALMAL